MAVQKGIIKKLNSGPSTDKGMSEGEAARESKNKDINLF